MRRWRPGHTDCVLLDIRMPRITGPEVHDWLRQRNPEVPVIFLSGYADVPTAVRAMRLGAFDFLEKPFNVQHLIERVNAALRLSDERRAAPAAAPAASGDDWRKS
jgi:two-component system response regulator FixJ